jgi:hypothetical protein
MAQVPWGRLLAGRRRVGWLSLSVPDLATAAQIKAWWKAFYMRLLRRWPGAAAIWRLEYQDRGAAHIHALVVWPGEGPAAFLAWAVEAWGEISDAPCQGVDFSWVRSWRELVSYMSDASKAGQGRPPVNKETGELLDSPGRWWGAIGDFARLLGAIRTLWGAPSWAAARRAIGGLAERRRRARCNGIIAALERKGRPDALERIRKVRAWASKRLHWRPGMAFVQDVPAFGRWVSDLATGPALALGLDSVKLPSGDVRTWERVSVPICCRPGRQG